MVKIETKKQNGRLGYVVTIDGQSRTLFADNLVAHDIPEQMVQSLADLFEVELGRNVSAELFEAFKNRPELPGLDDVTKEQLRALGDEQRVEILS